MPNSRPTVRSLSRALAVSLSLLATPTLLAGGPDPEPAPPTASPERPAPLAVELRTQDARPITNSTPASGDQRPLGRAAAESPHSGSTPPATGAGDLSVSRTSMALAAVLALIFVIAAIFKKLPRGGALGAALLAAGRAPSGVIEVLGRFTLSRGVTLILLKVDRRVVLISQTGQRSSASLSTLCEMADADEVASIIAKCRSDAGETITSRFQSTLTRADRTTAAVQPTAARRPVRTPAPAPTPDATQVSAALRARLAAMRANTPVTKRMAA